MSRTTTALKRLGVPGIAAITLVAGLPLLTGTASAAHVGSVTLTPESSSASVGTCREFTAVLAPSAGSTLDATETVDVFISERAASGSQDVTFCQTDSDSDPATGPQAPDAGGTGIAVGTAGTTRRGEFTGTRAADGTVTVRFGVEALEPGTVDIRAFYEPDTANNNNFDGTELTDTAVLTVTAGNNATTNLGVASLDAEPESQTVFNGETATITATVRNAANDTLAGVTPRAVFNSGPNSGVTVTCTTSNNDGVSFCPFTPTANGTDTITVFVDQGAVVATAPTPGNGRLDANEPQDTVTVTTAAAPTGLAIEVTCDGPATDASKNTCVNPSSSTTETFTAVVTAADGTDAGTDRDPAANVIVRFTENGANATVSPVEATTNASGVATATLTRTNTTVESIVVTGTIRGQQGADTTVTATGGQRSTDSATKEFRGTNTNAADARTITLTPNNVETTAGDARTFTATVRDRFGIVVSGVAVNFTEAGPGRFVTGSASASDTTDANGQATVEVVSFRDERGVQQITATIGNLTPGANNDACEQAAGTPAGASPAGNCSATASHTLVAPVTQTTPPATNTTAPPTTTPPTSGTPANCTQTPTVVLERSTIIATGRVNYRVTGAPANSQVQIFAYSRPSTTYVKVRDVTIGADGNGPGGDGFTPPTNTRLYAQVVGCDTDESRFSVVINVRTQISLNVVRNGTKNYTFSGRLLPARPGGLIASLYRVTNDGRQILTAQTRANASDGRYVINRRFTGTGRFGFVVRTGQDLQNAPGSSNVRSLLVF